MPDQPAVSLPEALRRLTAPGAPFAMRECTVSGQRMRVFEQAPASLREVFFNARHWTGRTYLRFESEALSYTQLLEDASAFACALQARFGVTKGDRVAICMRNFPEWAVAYWAIIILGAVVVPVNAWGTGPEMTYVIQHSGACIVVADEERAERLAPHQGELALAGTVMTRSTTRPAGMAAFDDLVAAFRGAPLPPDPQVLPDDPATILYTSGTTGKPKGAVGTHRNAITCIVSGAFNVALSHMRRTGEHLVPDPSRPPPVYLSGGPLFHVGGCNSGLAATMAGGGCLVLMYKWDAGRALDLIETLGINGFGAVPTMAWQLLEHPAFDSHDLSSLASMAIGGAAAGPELHARIRGKLPHIVPATGCGATETSGGCTFNGGLDFALFPASVGVPAPVIDVKCVDETGSEVGLGAPGELCLRGPSVLQAYWNDPAATDATFREGWFHSGDIASRDAEGRITILDRAKDMVIRGGENVYSIEVEDAILAHRDVLAVAVFGLPDQILGEIVAAAVQVRPGARVSGEEIGSFAAGRLARFKVPSVIRVTEEDLPKNETGKILKRVLRQQLIES